MYNLSNRLNKYNAAFQTQLSDFTTNGNNNTNQLSKNVY